MIYYDQYSPDCAVKLSESGQPYSLHVLKSTFIADFHVFDVSLSINYGASMSEVIFVLIRNDLPDADSGKYIRLPTHCNLVRAR